VGRHRLGSGRDVATLEGFEYGFMLGQRQGGVVGAFARALPHAVRVCAGGLGHLVQVAVSAVAQDGFVEVPVGLEVLAVAGSPANGLDALEQLSGLAVLFGNLAFFLLSVFYSGAFEVRLNCIMGCFVFGEVLIARISMEEGA
jgi:hypothetical protein